MNETDYQIDLEKTINMYSNMLFRTCFVMLRNRADAEDIVQETFIKYMMAEMNFNDEEHKKAWLIKVSQNLCRDYLRVKKKHILVSYEDMQEAITSGKPGHLIEDVDEIIKISKLNYKYKSVVMLHYIEDYSVEETAEILGISVSAVKMRLMRARGKLRMAFEKVYKEELNR